MTLVRLLVFVFVLSFVFPDSLWSDNTDIAPAAISSPGDFKKIRIRWFPVESAESYLIYSIDADGKAIQIEEVDCIQHSPEKGLVESSGPLSGLCIAEAVAGVGSVELKVSAVNEDWEESELSGAPTF